MSTPRSLNDVNADLQNLWNYTISKAKYDKHVKLSSSEAPCPKGEDCMICGFIWCGEPLHFHHDGCPCCDMPSNESDVKTS